MAQKKFKKNYNFLVSTIQAGQGDSPGVIYNYPPFLQKKIVIALNDFFGEIAIKFYRGISGPSGLLPTDNPPSPSVSGAKRQKIFFAYKSLIKMFFLKIIPPPFVFLKKRRRGRLSVGNTPDGTFIWGGGALKSGGGAQKCPPPTHFFPKDLH